MTCAPTCTRVDALGIFPIYADPALIREHVVKLRLNDSEADLIEALVNYTGQQKAPLLRDLLLEQARLVLAGEANCEPARATSEGPQRDLFRGASVAASGTGTGP